MRLKVSTSVFLGAGALLLWLAAGQLDAAWPRASHTISGAVAEVDTRVVAGGRDRESRLVIRLEGHAKRFELAATMLRHLSPGGLLDAGRVTIDYDDTALIRANKGALGSCEMVRRTKTATGMVRDGGACAQYEALYVVTGLAVDGRVYFTPGMYRAAMALSALIVLVPGALLFGIGAMWLYRIWRNPDWRPRARGPRMRRAYGAALSFTAAGAGDRWKTADGHWLH